MVVEKWQATVQQKKERDEEKAMPLKKEKEAKWEKSLEAGLLRQSQKRKTKNLTMCEGRSFGRESDFAIAQGVIMVFPWVDRLSYFIP